MIRRHAALLRLGLMAADGTSAVILFVAISIARFGPDWRQAWESAGIDPLLAVVSYAAVWMGLLWLLGLYRLRARWSFRSEFMDVGRASLLLAITVFSALFVLKLPDVSRFFLLWLFAAQVVTTIVSRAAIRALLRLLRDRGYNLRYMVIVGTGPAATAFAARVERHRELGLRVIGYVALDDAEPAATAEPVLGRIGEIHELFGEHVVDEVAICLDVGDAAWIEPIARLAEEEGKIVRIPIDELPINLAGGRVEVFDRGRVLSLVYGPDRVLSLVVKRLIDLSAGMLALAVLLPVFAIVSVAIVVVDGRPVFFRQTRVGLQGRPFRVVKFRTMVADAEARLTELEELNEIKGHAFKVTDDPRITRTGRFLRKASIDELPQLWNVIRGEMSLVGPRPPLPREVAGYDMWHRRRLSMPPGITGLWQVAGRREDQFDRWVELDLAYIDRWSLWLDLKIVFRTIPAMLQGR